MVKITAVSIKITMVVTYCSRPSFSSHKMAQSVTATDARKRTTCFSCYSNPTVSSRECVLSCVACGSPAFTGRLAYSQSNSSQTTDEGGEYITLPRSLNGNPVPTHPSKFRSFSAFFNFSTRRQPPFSSTYVYTACEKKVDVLARQADFSNTTRTADDSAAYPRLGFDLVVSARTSLKNR